MAMIFISSTLMAQSQYNDAYFFVKRQGVYALLGLGALFLGRYINYHNYKRWVYRILLLSLITLVLVFVPGIGGKVRGAARWLRLGPLTLQPSEFAKLAMVMFLAYSLSRKQDKMKYFAIGFLPHMLVAGLFIALILKEPDFGTSVTLGAIVFTMLFVGGTRVTHILLSLSAVIPLGVLMVMRDPKKFARVLSFMDPWKHGQDVGYQLKQALLASAPGGCGAWVPARAGPSSSTCRIATPTLSWPSSAKKWASWGSCWCWPCLPSSSAAVCASASRPRTASARIWPWGSPS